MCDLYWNFAHYLIMASFYYKKLYLKIQSLLYYELAL
jgi:hypothetical protein